MIPDQQTGWGKKTAMIKGPVSKSLAALGGKTKVPWKTGNGRMEEFKEEDLTETILFSLCNC